MAKRRISSERAAVLALFLTGGDRPRYGLEIIREAGIPSGTVYPLLMQLETDGILASTWERIDESVLGRPKRRLYTLNRHDRARRELRDWEAATAKRRAAQTAATSLPNLAPT